METCGVERTELSLKNRPTNHTVSLWPSPHLHLGTIRRPRRCCTWEIWLELKQQGGVTFQRSTTKVLPECQPSATQHPLQNMLTAAIVMSQLRVFALPWALAMLAMVALLARCASMVALRPRMPLRTCRRLSAKLQKTLIQCHEFTETKTVNQSERRRAA